MNRKTERKQCLASTWFLKDNNIPYELSWEILEKVSIQWQESVDSAYLKNILSCTIQKMLHLTQEMSFTTLAGTNGDIPLRRHEGQELVVFFNIV